MKNHYALALAGLAMLFVSETACSKAPKVTDQMYINCSCNLKNIGHAMVFYAHDHKGTYASSLERLSPNYLVTIPHCPAGPEASYQLVVSPDAKAYTVVCAGSRHEAAGVKGDFPQYTSAKDFVPK
jgi:hypothetical protein